ncbi:MAG: hypothetical protein V4528_12895 [Pseudomonadota bacterium]
MLKRDQGASPCFNLDKEGHLEMRKKWMQRGLVLLMLAAVPGISAAESDGSVTGDKATDMVVDLVVLRPLGLVGTVLGSVLTVVALPFTIPSGSVGDSARALVVKPAEYTFKRPLGDFHTCNEDRAC